MRRSLLSLIAAVSLVVAVARCRRRSAIPVHWTAKGGRAFTDVARGPDGSLYVAGIDRSSITAAASLRKYSPDGSLRWTRSVGALTAGEHERSRRDDRRRTARST